MLYNYLYLKKRAELIQLQFISKGPWWRLTDAKKQQQIKNFKYITFKII